jgi:predicted acetyltransferase
MSPRLVAPDLAYMVSYVAALEEGYAPDKLRPETPESIAAIAADPAGYIARLRRPPPTVTLPDGRQVPRIPETPFWYVDGDTFLGLTSVRHWLTENLERWGGHIGYVVRPSARGQGHASAMLAGMLDHCRAALPLDRVLLTVNSKNPASIRVIEKNGGVLGDTIPHPFIEGDLNRRYWIALR